MRDKLRLVLFYPLILIGLEMRYNLNIIQAKKKRLNQQDLDVFFVFGAGNEIRTRDPNLGKVVLYQLSYSRNLGCAFYKHLHTLQVFYALNFKNMLSIVLQFTN